MHCKNTTPKVFQPEFNSLRMVATAAMQGVYKRQKAKKLQADSVVNKLCIATASCSVPTPKITPKVLTTASFAVKPDTNAAELLAYLNE